MKGICCRHWRLAFLAAGAAAFRISAAELVAHWRMDESAELAVLAPAEGTNSILLKNGMVAGAAAVDGTGVRGLYGGSAQIVGSKELIPATNDFSVFLWAAYTNEPARTTQKHLFSCNAGQVNRCAFAVDMAATPGTLGWWHHEGGGLNGVTAVNDGEWHHVGVIRREGRIELWVDGVRDALATAAFPAVAISQAQDWRLASGATESAAWSFAGQLDDLRVYHGALTAEEVLALTASYVPRQALHRWRFDEAAGSLRFAPDSGWMRAVPVKAVESGVRAVDQGGLRLDGTAALRIPGSKCLVPATNDFSVFLWMRDDASAVANVQLFSCNAEGSAQPNRCSLGLSYNTTTEAGKLYMYHPDGRVTGSAVVKDSGWHHVGMVRRGNLMELWVDGDLDASSAFADGFAISQAHDWRVGAGASETVNFLTGRIDDLRVYTNALAFAEIAALYESYTPSNSLVAHWRFNDAANVRFLQPEAGWREICATNMLQAGGQGVDGAGLWANTNSRGRILGSKKLIPATNDFTVLLWIRTANATASEKHLFTNNRGQAGRCNLTLDATAGKLTWWANNTFGLVSVNAGTGPVIDDGVWHQVGISRSARTFRLWVDGVNVSSATSAAVNPPVTQSNDWFIASNASDAGAAFYGAVGSGYALMDDLRVYNYALDASAVSGLYVAFQPFPSAAPAAPMADHSAIEAGTGGRVVGHLPKISEESGFHLPSLLVRGDGSYLVAGTVLSSPLGTHTKVYRSADQGASWSKVSEVAPLYGGALFEDNGTLHLLGNSSDGGSVVIRRSTDNGATWTVPASAASGLLTTNTGWYFRAGAVAVHGGRVWVYVERRGNVARGTYAANVEAGALSAPQGADLLDAANWTVTEPLTPIPAEWDTTVNFRGWTDGRAVADKDNVLRMLMRVNRFSDHAEYLALLSASGPSAGLSHTPFDDMALLPGGGSAFGVRYDGVSKRYWALTNPETTSNLGLFSSFALRDWAFHAMPLEAQAGRTQAFMWPEFQVDGDDLVAVCRTCYADQDGEPASINELNYLLFKRIPNFRQLEADKAEARLLVADTGNGRIRRYGFGAAHEWLFDDGLKTIFAEGVYAGQVLTAPYGLATAGDRVFVSEGADGGRVLAFTKRGAFLGVLHTFGSGSVPGALATDGLALYVSDAGSDQVWSIDLATGAVGVRVAASGSGYALDDPRGLACDGSGNLYVASNAGDAILKFNKACELEDSFTQDAPEALAWDSETGRLLASVYLAPDILSIDPASGVATKLLDNAVGSQRFCGLAKVGGALFFTSDANDRMNRLTGSTTFTAADIRLSSPGQLLLLPQGAAVFPEAKLGSKIMFR